MKSFGSFYTQRLTYPKIYKYYPIVELGWTDEIEEPYRPGRCIVLKPPFTDNALVLGMWGRPRPESKALFAAVNGRDLDLDPSEIMEW